MYPFMNCKNQQYMAEHLCQVINVSRVPSLLSVRPCVRACVRGVTHSAHAYSRLTHTLGSLSRARSLPLVCLCVCVCARARACVCVCVCVRL